MKKAEKRATLIRRNPLKVGLRSMKPFLKNYFKDYPGIVSKLKIGNYIKHKNYKDNFSQLIQDYNSFCN